MRPGSHRHAASVLWRRLDSPGHDACSLTESDGGWRLAGTAVFVHEGGPARLDYDLACDGSWRTLRGEVSGWIGAKPVAHATTRSEDGRWIHDGAAVPGLEACVDLDLGFSPATNLLQLRRLALAEGQAADAPAAWLDVTTGALELLAQRYERRAALAYWYEAPRFGYAALLEVDALGFVRRYPGLWEVEATSGTSP
ncbi:MAG TPA: putative glycolipid-binding domain-containing protein [Polyangia bacterium]|nr:putative glycolipid-binding domain-containing protein [Polyangia bacterium]